MPFVRLPGITGKVYIPETDVLPLRKHPCQDCFRCQHCTDDRCAVCRRGKPPDPTRKTKNRHPPCSR
jgi:hypothetical protein